MPKMYRNYKSHPSECPEMSKHYCRHISAMTGEDLHSKSAIACELAHRDMEIEYQKEDIKHNNKYQTLAMEQQDQIEADRAQIELLQKTVKKLEADIKNLEDLAQYRRF